MTSFSKSTGALIVALGAAALASPPARADEVVTAQALFDQAKKAMAAHDYATACPKFEASLKLQDALGTMLNLALCYEQEGKLASAWSRFLEVAAKARAAGQTERARIGRDRAAALAPKLSNMVVDVPPASRVEGLEIRRDGVSVEQAEWGAAIPVDAGPHTIEASAPNRKPWSQTVTVADGAATMRVAVGELAPLEAEAAAARPPADASPLPPPPNAAPTDSGTERGKQGNGLKIAALATGGAAVAGFGVGAVFGILSLAKHNDAANACPPSVGKTCPSQQGANDWNDAYGFGNVSTVAFIAGGACLAAGVVLWLVAPKHAQDPGPAARLTVGPGAFDVRGSW